ncbi:outer membrane protein W [Aquimarina sp. EL_43]|uniref:hypothetical protein n=1 Tax=unclassified Aquimarina TaxID=2627091 RepID=UPI0018C92FD4|nr:MULTISPECIES: hypothetical protein [unclassified Aquimarina]MBG6129203.1 outer membrane protein W [Aquimarina sp. EL_35]MBG6150268.1 outer membrane protein W [Aquimarina sp. EL_32]MBG6167047.1 outer membrane protein W [Aquimarina sp. EL_43]
MRQIFLMTFILFYSFNVSAQGDILPTTDKKRLDFAKTYFELGGNLLPSFTGKRLSGNELISFKHPETLNTTLYWGGFHFWGHAEFYVSFPLKQFNLKSNEETDVEFTHYTVTGARFLPWAYRENRLRPYVGIGWSALDFKQIVKPDEDQPKLEKNFAWTADAGVLYGYKNFTARLGVNYYPDNVWNYPISKTEFQKIKTPNFSLQLGLLYAMDLTKDNGDPTINKRWNSYPEVSSLGYNASSFGDFFAAVGPSVSFSLAESEYNNSEYPYLNKKQASGGYFDIALGYQFNTANMFTAVSFRNPKFEQQAYGTRQTIKKTSIALETAKFLTDYTGFAPFIGLNVAYDHIKYSEITDEGSKKLTFNKIEPGITIGWDIVPGKSEEYLILRTNLRWYPLSSFEVDGEKFNFNQLEYNLIQLVFYPERFLRSKKNIFK